MTDKKDSKPTFKDYLGIKSGGDQFFNAPSEPLTTKKPDYLKKRDLTKKKSMPRKTKDGYQNVGKMVNSTYFQEDTQNPEADEVVNHEVRTSKSEIPISNSQAVDDLEQELETDDQDDQNEEDPNRQGLIRKVDGAHLVHKRQSPEGSYEELWIYRLGRAGQDDKIRKAILAGTDIDPETGYSEDNQQYYEVWTAGNAQMVKIFGLPS